MLEHARRDLVQAVRGLSRRPAFAIGAMLTLAVAIGANTAVFSVVDAVVLRPPPPSASTRASSPPSASSPSSSLSRASMASWPSWWSARAGKSACG